ncbi:hypothetical protein BH09VER1_BH09VER1_23910 [soil metagenome]
MNDNLVSMPKGLMLLFKLSCALLTIFVVVYWGGVAFESFDSWMHSRPQGEMEQLQNGKMMEDLRKKLKAGTPL